MFEKSQAVLVVRVDEAVVDVVIDHDVVFTPTRP